MLASPALDPLGKHATEKDPNVRSFKYPCCLLRVTLSNVITTTAIELLANQLFYRTRARVERMCLWVPPSETPLTLSSPAARLPLEIVENIITYLVYDMRSLRMCSLTSCSWYIAAVPHLHRPFIIGSKYRDKKYMWPNPIRQKHRLGLLPLVKKLRIYNYSSTVWVQKKLFSSRTLRQFGTLTNVRDLKIGQLDIPSFTPNIQRYFGHFVPTLKSLTLALPKGSHQQIIFFIGLFQHLEDLMLHDDTFCTPDQPGGGSSLAPPFVPPLRGRLVVWRFKKAGFLKDMIRSFGGLKFSEINVFDVAETRLLLSESAGALRSIQLRPTDPRGERPDLKFTMRFSVNDSTAASFLRDFDLSRNKSLRTLEILAEFIVRQSLSSASEFLKYALSTIRSRNFSRVALLYQECDFRGVDTRRHSEWPHLHQMSQVERAEEALRHHDQFWLLSEMHKVRRFQMELCANVWGPVQEYAVQVLREAVAAERTEGWLVGSFSEPLVTKSPHWDLRG